MKRSLIAKALAFLLPIGLLRFSVDDPGGGGGSSFSREYVQDLRDEAKGWRLKAQAAESKVGELTASLEKATSDAKTAAEAHAAALKKAGEDAAAKVQEASDAASAALVRAKIEAAATKAGMVDLDGLKLADLSTVKLNDKGEVDGADALLTALKTSKPYLFGPAGNSSPPNNPPPANPPGPKAVKDMTEAEYAQSKAALLAAR